MGPAVRGVAARALALVFATGFACGQNREPPKGTSSELTLGIMGCWRGDAEYSGDTVVVNLEISPWYTGQLLVRVTAAKLGVVAAQVAGAVEMGRVSIALGSGLYRGVLSPDGMRLQGSWEMGKAKVPIDFSRASSFPGHPQEPKRPYPYRDEEVTFVNAAAKRTFHATLTIPRTAGRHPAVVLVSGMGCQDRDETLAGHRVFLVVADRLTRRGIAVLRYDDRGFPASPNDCMQATSDDNASDALAAAAYLGSRPDVDPARIGIIGHSEGGMVALMAAARSPAIKLVVSLAGVAQKCEDLGIRLLSQYADANRVPLALKLAGRVALWPVVSILKSDATDEEVAAKLRALIPAEIVPMLSCRWTRFMARYDPAVAIEKIRCPILGLYGSEDTMVPAPENTEALRVAAKRGGNEDVTIVTFPRMNHILQLNNLTPAERARDDSIAAEVLDKLETWVADKMRPAAESR